MNIQHGRGLPYYHSTVAFQRGHGLGGVLGKLFKTLVPLIQKPVVRKTLKRIGRSALDTGISAVRDTVSTPNSKFSDNLKRHTKRNIGNILTKSKKGNRKPIARAVTTKGKRAILVKAKPREKRKLDIFDYQ